MLLDFLLFDSSLVFGDDYYRGHLNAMHDGMNVKVLLEATKRGAIAFHLFTSSGDRTVHKDSLVDFLFKAADAKSEKIQIPLGELSRKRRFMAGSDTYVEKTQVSLAAKIQFTSPPTAQQKQALQGAVQTGFAQQFGVPMDQVETSLVPFDQVRRMLQEGYSVTVYARVTGLSEDEANDVVEKATEDNFGEALTESVREAAAEDPVLKEAANSMEAEPSKPVTEVVKVPVTTTSTQAAATTTERMTEQPTTTSMKTSMRMTTTERMTEGPATTTERMTEPVTTTAAPRSTTMASEEPEGEYASMKDFKALEEKSQSNTRKIQELNSQISQLMKTFDQVSGTVDTVQQGQKDLASCAANYLGKSTQSSMAPPETSRAATETSSAPEGYTFLAEGTKCQDNQRTFKEKDNRARGDDLSTCVERCQNDKDCRFVSYGIGWCIGCGEAPTSEDHRFNSFEVEKSNRRSLMDEVEALRAENAALRARLSN